ncbi:hypothetical protein DPMN_034988 [Dreissena polymorpha]|uniref:Uncharacterized protein n=1 Tax=Dreissena polymorpha TaxID=45954 RepID=A0A9D4M8K3_DREPO|nr:hypothetical protein DPMN_034988 [Dreissena polymorpha]
MWPYEKKTVFDRYGPKTLNITNSLGSGGPVLTSKAQSLDMEYYKRLTMSVSVGVEHFPVHTIDSAGRIFRQHGVTPTDVTGDYLVGKGTRSYRESRSSVRPLHNRNVSQLKVVLSMPDRQRAESLAHITGPIVENEVAEIRNDEFLREHLKKQTYNNVKLPLLRRRLSLDRAKRIETVTDILASSKDRRLSVKYGSDDENTLLLPCIGKQYRRGSSDHFRETLPERVTWDPAVSRRRESVSQKEDESDSEVKMKYEHGIHKGFRGSRRPSVGMPLRKDSVGRFTESIRDQLRAALMSTNTTENQDESTPKLVVASDTVTEAPFRESRSSVMGYKLRHEYGKNLERNWFKNQMIKRQMKGTHGNGSAGDGLYDLRLDIFYSPEPQSDDEVVGTDDGENDTHIEDDASIRCGAFSTATAEQRYKQRNTVGKGASLRKSLSLETCREEDEQAEDDDSSASDIEIVLKDNQLIQRKTKQKMKKKRQRQLERYRAFNSPEKEAVRENFDYSEPELPLTDPEIRALRLKLKTKEKMRKLRGKRKFLQIANAVYAFVIFKRALLTIRKRKRLAIKKRAQTNAQMVARKMKQQQKQSELSEIGNGGVETYRPTLKDQFMKEVGQKLMFDIERLRIDIMDSSTDGEESDEDEHISQNQGNSEEYPKREHVSGSSLSNKRTPSKFEKEVKKISVNDLDNVHKKTKRKRSRRHRTRRRRHSVPCRAKPTEFIIEFPDKSRRRREQPGKTKEVRKRSVSPVAPRCSCQKHRPDTQRSVSQIKMASCSHQPPARRKKMKTVTIQTDGLMRTHSLVDLRNKRPIELETLLKDIDIPAKGIRLQILARKFRRQRRKRQLIRLSPVRMPERYELPPEEKSHNEAVTTGTEDTEESDYDFVYGGPFVGSGVMWNQNSQNRKPTWTEADVDREVQRITRIFHEMKECRYLRLNGLNEAIINRLETLKRKDY